MKKETLVYTEEEMQNTLNRHRAEIDKLNAKHKAEMEILQSDYERKLANYEHNSDLRLEEMDKECCRLRKAIVELAKRL